MATRTKPLISAAALASAAVVAMSTAEVAPTVSAPTPTALSAAQVQLTTFSDLLSITPEDWNNVLFGGWGFAISPNQPLELDWAAAFISPFTNCDFNCQVNGPSGLAYLALDALINGNGAGIDNVNGILQDPAKPYQPDPDKPDFNPYTTPPWSISSINYFFEAGAGSGAQYLVTQPFGDPASPLYDPAVATLIGRAFLGLDNVSVTLIQTLDLVSKLALDNVPFLGPYIYGAIQAALGPNTSDPTFGDWGYFAGLSGVLRYAIDVVLTGGNPFPPYGPPVNDAAASTLASAAVAAPAAVSRVESVSADAVPAAGEAEGSAPVGTEAADSDVAGAEAVAASVETAPVEAVAEVAPVEAVAEVAPVEAVAEVAPVETVTEVAPVEPVAEVAPVEAATGITPVDITPVDPPAEAADPTTGIQAVDVADSAPASAPTKAPRRAVRGAMERAAKSITSAVGGSKTAKVSAPGAAAAGKSSPDKSSSDKSSSGTGSSDTGSKASAD